MWTSDINPSRTATILRSLSRSVSGRQLYEELILKFENNLSLIIDTPKEFTEAYIDIVCKQPSHFDSSPRTVYPILERYSLPQPTYLKGPFIVLLRSHPYHGVDLINRLVNHAMDYWMRKNKDRNPIPQYILVNKKKRIIWGDYLVFSWFRFPGSKCFCIGVIISYIVVSKISGLLFSLLQNSFIGLA